MNKREKWHLAAAFCDYQRTHDMLRHIGMSEKVLRITSTLMEGCKTRLEVTECGKVTIKK